MSNESLHIHHKCSDIEREIIFDSPEIPKAVVLRMNGHRYLNVVINNNSYPIKIGMISDSELDDMARSYSSHLKLVYDRTVKQTKDLIENRIIKLIVGDQEKWQ